MPRHATVIESLESRTLMAADLSVSIASTTLPDTIVLGVKSKATTASLLVANSGDAIAKTTPGTVSVDVGLRDGDGIVTTLGTANVKASTLSKPTPAKAKVKIALPAELAEGAYTLVANVHGGEVIPEDNTANNSVDGKAVVAEQANADLLVSATTTLTGSVAAGTSGVANVSVTNDGNVPSKATGVLQVTSTVSGVTTVLTTVEKVRLNLKPGATTNLKPVSFKAQNLTEADVQATIGTNLTSTALGDDASNNSADAATLTIAPPPPSPLAAIGVGEQMTFVKTDGANFHGTGFESGNWTDSNGRTGTYYLTTGLASDGACALTSNGTPLAGLQFAFNHGKTKLGGTTLTFGVDPSAAKGSVEVAGSTVYFA